MQYYSRNLPNDYIADMAARLGVIFVIKSNRPDIIKIIHERYPLWNAVVVSDFECNPKACEYALYIWDTTISDVCIPHYLGSNVQLWLLVDHPLTMSVLDADGIKQMLESKDAVDSTYHIAPSLHKHIDEFRYAFPYLTFVRCWYEVPASFGINDVYITSKDSNVCEHNILSRDCRVWVVCKRNTVNKVPSLIGGICIGLGICRIVRRLRKC